MIETAQINRLTDTLTTAIQDRYDDDCFIRQAMICVEIDKGPSTAFLAVSADDRSWVQIAFLDAVANYLEERQRKAQTEWDT